MSNKITTIVSNYHNEKVRDFVKLRKISLSRMIAGIIDNELSKENPFDFDCRLPDVNTYDINAYSDQGGKIISFLDTSDKGYGLDVLTMLRYDIGVPDKLEFLAGFAGALSIGLIIVDDSHRPPSQDFGHDYKYYKSKTVSGADLKQQRQRIKDIKQLEKLQKRLKIGGVNDV